MWPSVVRDVSAGPVALGALLVLGGIAIPHLMSALAGLVLVAGGISGYRALVRRLHGSSRSVAGK
jgi:hypothetical protein